MRVDTILLAVASFPTASAVNYVSTDLGSCSCIEHYCSIDTRAACEDAAEFLNIEDTKANVLNRMDHVAGCSVNDRGGLRFNAALNSPAIHDDNDPDKVVLCMPCSPFDFDLVNAVPCPATPVTFPPDRVTSEQIYQVDTLCECEGLCSLESAEECETAAAQRGYPDHTANVRTSLTMVRGCSTNQGGGLRFNTAFSTAIHNGNRGKDVLCKPCAGTVPVPPVECVLDRVPGSASTPFSNPKNGKCEGAYCHIQNLADCQAASDYFNLGYTLTEDNIVDQNIRVRGCSTSIQDGLVFNVDGRNVLQDTDDQSLMCIACPTTTTAAPTTDPGTDAPTTTTTTLASAVLSGEACSGDYCPISSSLDCQAAANAVGASGTLSTVSSSMVPAGCSVAGGTLVFNDNAASPALPSGRGSNFICELCSSPSGASASRAGEEEASRDDSKNGDKWWIYLVGGAATVAVVAIVVVVVTVRKSRKTVVPTERTQSNEAQSDDTSTPTSSNAVNIVAAGSIAI